VENRTSEAGERVENANYRLPLAAWHQEMEQDASHRLFSFSKYPPAKPGALRCEPLKAASGFGAVSHLLRGMRHQVPKLTILKHAHLDAPLFAAA